MSVAIHCDKSGCDTWALVGPMLEGWVEYVRDEDSQHFCSPWHCLQWLAEWAEPPTEIPL